MTTNLLARLGAPAAAMAVLLLAPLAAAAPRPTAELLRELDSPDVLTRQFALAGLSDHAEKDAEARRALLGALRDPDAGPRLTARYGLSQAGPKSKAALAAYDKGRLARLYDGLASPSYERLRAAVVTLNRSGCGTLKAWQARSCEASETRVHGDGAVRRRRSPDGGKESDTVVLRDPDQIRELLAAFGRARFFELEDSYEKGAREEMEMAGDIALHPRPFHTLTLSFDGEEKIVRRYEGDDTAPSALAELEAAVEKLAAAP